MEKTVAFKERYEITNANAFAIFTFMEFLCWKLDCLMYLTAVAVTCLLVHYLHRISNHLCCDMFCQQLQVSFLINLSHTVTHTYIPASSSVTLPPTQSLISSYPTHLPTHSSFHPSTH